MVGSSLRHKLWCPALGSGLLSKSYRIHSCSMGGMGCPLLSAPWDSRSGRTQPLLSHLVFPSSPLNRGLLAWLPSSAAAGCWNLAGGEGRESQQEGQADSVRLHHALSPPALLIWPHTRVQTRHTHTHTGTRMQSQVHAPRKSVGTLVHIHPHISCAPGTAPEFFCSSTRFRPGGWGPPPVAWPAEKRLTSFRMRVSR